MGARADGTRGAGLSRHLSEARKTRVREQSSVAARR